MIGGTPDFLAPQEVEDDDDITSSDEAPDLDDDGGFRALQHLGQCLTCWLMCCSLWQAESCQASS